MVFTFETSGNNTFLVYAIQEEDVLDTMTLGMITNNRIPGMVSVLYTQMNRDCFLKYTVTAKVTVKQFFSGVVNKRRLLGVFSSVASVLAVAEEYMIDCNSLLLDTDYIYADVSTCKAEVICLPVIRETENMDIGLFFKNIMFSTQFDQTENCDYVARIINCLNSMPVFAAAEFLHLLEELQEAGSSSAPQGEQVQPIPLPQILTPVPSQQFVQISQVNIPAQSQQPVPVPRAQDSEQPRQPAPAFREQGNPAVAGMGFSVPGQGGDGGFAVQASPESSTPKKEISMLYLLQHYNKENVAAYKAQREARKKGGTTASDALPGSAHVSGFAVQ